MADVPIGAEDIPAQSRDWASASPSAVAGRGKVTLVTATTRPVGDGWGADTRGGKWGSDGGIGGLTGSEGTRVRGDGDRPLRAH